MWNRNRDGNGTDDLLGDVVKGALAGAVATWAMGRVTTFLYEREDQAARRREDAVRDGKTAFGIAAEKGAELVGRSLDDRERERYGAALHWALGIGAGAAYGALRGRVPGADLAAGLLFGTVFWAVVDEGANPVLGLTPGPGAFPWQAHARGLAGHLAFGAAADASLRAMEAVG
jgi:hypothetical protein